MSAKVRFNNPQKADFYSTLRTRVDSYFSGKGISKGLNGFMTFKITFFLGVLVSSYLLLVFGHFSLPVSFLLWIILGLFCAFVGVNVCHDAIHGSLSENKMLNKSLGLVFNVLGANAYLWSIMHNNVHHTYTNIEGHDEDIKSVPVLRMSPHQKLMKVHRYQHWYAFMFYGLASISWVFIKDYVKFFKKNIGGYETKKHPPIEYFNLFFFKAVYYFLFLALPLMVMDFHWWIILGGFFVMHFFEGFALAIIFMLAHLVEEADFPLPAENGRIENNWAVHQMQTTANFATNSFLVSFFTGGLNFQVEHHLFPLICHVHYKEVSRIVEQTAKEFGVPYYSNPTFTGAIGSHIRLLKKLGRQPETVLVPVS